MRSPHSCISRMPTEYVSNRSGRPNCHASGDSSADRNATGARGKLRGITSSSGGLRFTARQTMN